MMKPQNSKDYRLALTQQNDGSEGSDDLDEVIHPALFEYSRSRTLKKEQAQVAKDKKTVANALKSGFAEGNYAAADEKIIYALHYFRYLNKYSLTRYLNQVSNLPQNCKKPDYSTNLRKLYKEGILVKYAYNNWKTGIDSGHETKNVFYTLAEPAKEWADKKYGERKGRNRDGGEIEYILETLSLNQYHIALLAASGGYIVSSRYDETESIEGFEYDVASEVTLLADPKKYHCRYVTVMALPMPQNDLDRKRFLSSVLLANKYVNDKEYGTTILLVICPHLRDEKLCAAKLMEFDELKDLKILFTRDSHTKGLYGITDNISPLSRMDLPMSYSRNGKTATLVMKSVRFMPGKRLPDRNNGHK